MNRFAQCLAYVLRHEGGYVNHPADRGGATNRGITQATYDEWRVSNGLSRNPVVGISADEVSAIYRTRYWRPCGADRFGAPLDLVVFDAAVQHGPGRAAKWLQRVVGAVPDGQVGPMTVRAVDAFVERNGMAALVGDLLGIREGFYREIVANDPTQKVFAKGWANRLEALRTEVQGCG